MNTARQLPPACLLLALALALTTAACATPLSSFEYMSNGQVGPEGNQVTFGVGESYFGRVHVNGMGAVGVAGLPIFHGFYSQTGPAVINLSEDWYPNVFQGGWSIPHVALRFPFTEELQTVRDQCLPFNHWQGRQDSLDLTTLIHFDGYVYHAAQYAESQIAGGDTLWHTPWITIPLPWPAAPMVVWVEGVARVKGVVNGQVTLLASDSLFIMGDLITADTDTVHYSDQERFGASPVGSTQRIGLIGEKDIIIAATQENGFADGLNSPGITCGLANHPVIWGNSQRRRDVVIHASLLALGCSFEAEFWKTTAWGCSVPQSHPQFGGCSGQSNTHVTVWDNTPGGSNPDCLGAANLSDRRGTLWFCGSLAVGHPGFIVRNPIGPWGNATIGYQNRVRRFDANLLQVGPPWWPEVDWDVQYTMDVLLQTGTASACGPVTDASAFVQDWFQGDVRLRLRSVDYPGGLALALTWVNGQVADSAWVMTNGGAFTYWTPTLDLTPWLAAGASLRLEVQRGEQVGWPPQWDVLNRWNANGEECVWSWNAPSSVAPMTSAAFSLSQPWPNPFNPVTQVELCLPAAGVVRLEVFDLAGRREAVIHDGPLAAGAQAFTIDASSWAAGLHLLRVTHDSGVETRKLLLLK